jgi:hypothetical protein
VRSRPMLLAGLRRDLGVQQDLCHCHQEWIPQQPARGLAAAAGDAPRPRSTSLLLGGLRILTYVAAHAGHGDQWGHPRRSELPARAPCRRERRPARRHVQDVPLLCLQPPRDLGHGVLRLLAVRDAPQLPRKVGFGNATPSPAAASVLCCNARCRRLTPGRRAHRSVAGPNAWSMGIHPASEDPMYLSDGNTRSKFFQFDACPVRE